MNSLETKLQSLPITPAPEHLDRRVEQTILAYTSGPVGIVSMRIPLWLCATACLLCFAVGMVVRQPSPTSVHAASAPIVCSIEGGPAFRAFFAPEPQPKDFFLRKKRIIDPQTNKNGA